MDKTREARRSTSMTMAAPNGLLTKRRQRISESESSRGQMHQEKERDPASLNRTKKRRSGSTKGRNVEEDSSGEILGDANNHRKSFSARRIPRHAATLKIADDMMGVPVPRKARSACMKRSHDCRTSSGSGGGGFGEDRRRHPTSSGCYSFEVVSTSSSTVSVKQKKKVRSVDNYQKQFRSNFELLKFPGAIEDDLEIEIAEVLSGLKRQPHCTQSQTENDSQKSSEVKGVQIGGLINSNARIEATDSANIDKSTENHQTNITAITSSLLSDIPAEIQVRQEAAVVSKGVSEVGDDSNASSKLEIDLMVPATLRSSPEKVSLLPLLSDSIVTKEYCKILVKNDTTTEQVKEKKVEKHELLNLDLERPSQGTGIDAIRRSQSLDWSQPQQSKSAQMSSVLPLPEAVGCWPSGLSPQGDVPLIQNSKPVDSNNGSSSFVQTRPKRCATHFFIARNIQLHQHFVKANNLAQPNPSLQGSSPFLSLNTQAQDRIVVNSSVPKDKASKSGHFALTRQKKLQPPPPASSSIVPPPAFIFPTNHHLQPVMVPSKSHYSTKNPCEPVRSASVNFNHPSTSASEAFSQYVTVLPNNAYSFQLSSSIRGFTPSQALPFFNGSFYSPQMFQPPQLLQKQSQGQRETKAASCSSSSHMQLQPQGSVIGLSSQANVQKHDQQSQMSEAKAAGPYCQIMRSPVQPQKFSMSFPSFASGVAPANLNFSSNGYHIVSAPPAVHQKNHQGNDSKKGGRSCSSNAEDKEKTLPGKPPAMMNGQTLVFDNPSRTLNFVSCTWPPPSATTINGDPSTFPHHLTQRQQLSGRSKTTIHSQADSVLATSSQWRNPAYSSLTSCNSLNLKQFQSQQQMRTHGQTQISFATPSKSQPSQGRPGDSSSSVSVTGSASQSKASNCKVSNSKALPVSPAPPSFVGAQDQAENSASGSTQKTSPICGRNVPPIITSCPGHLSELKY